MLPKPKSILLALTCAITLQAEDFPSLNQYFAALPSQSAPNEVILLLDEGVPFAEVAWDLLDRIDYTQYNLVNAVWVKSPILSTRELLELFSQPPYSNFVRSVTPNYAYIPLSNDPYYQKQWGLENQGQEVNGEAGTYDADIDAEEAWEIERGRRSLVVAVLDTGVDYTHSDLRENMWQGNPYHGYDFAGDDEGNNDPDPMPDAPYDENGHYHGTLVAGVIGAVGDNGEGISGVAPEISIMALKVFRPNGYGYTSDILEALDYVSQKVEEGEPIVAINASFGGPGGSQDDATNEAIKRLGEQGVILCAAAGNEGKNIDDDPIYPAAYDAPNIISVAASDQHDNLADFSNYGPESVDIAAPGVNILSTYPGDSYAYADGTSLATPFVTGSIALLSALHPQMGVEEKIALINDYGDYQDAYEGVIGSAARLNLNNSLRAKAPGDGGEDGESGGGDGGSEEPEPQNTPPVAHDDEATTQEGESVAIDVLANDSDPDGDAIWIESYEQPSHGWVEERDGLLVYTPEDGFSGQDRFRYTISDGQDQAVAWVYVEVEERNEGGGGFFGGLFGGGWFW
ncbi:MAG: hypothetical protein C6I00_02330 [Nitratiruptor sp.]|nr:hypothetical protein [Nitratiruptor sp.]NPA84123.1 S8 family serine peptidase [Campylobacterota bacterium]